MRKPYLPLFILLSLSLTSNTFAQGRGDHLEPVEGFFDLYDSQFSYYSKVRKILFEGLTRSPEIRFQVFGPFGNEMVLDIEFHRDQNTYVIVFHKCEESIWLNKNWETVSVKKYRSEIDKESVDIIKTLFEAAIMQTRYPDESWHGLDGVNYYFSVNSFGMKSGTIWSPDDGTKMQRLTTIGNLLIGLALSEESDVRLNDELRKEIEALKSELR